jgi:hypothetical protein
MVRAAKLSPTERARRADACKRAWLERNWEYNQMQKRIIAGLPDRLAKRREQYRERRETYLYEKAQREEAQRAEMQKAEAQKADAQAEAHQGGDA